MKYITTLFLFVFVSTVSVASTNDHSHGSDNDQVNHDHGDQNNMDHHGYAFGDAGNPEKADRTIEILMTDNQYDLPELGVNEGETVHFKIKNAGQQIHEFTIGTTAMHEQHQDEMLEHISSGHMTMTDKGHGSGHDHANSLLLNPGEQGELTWTFAKAENLEFACNVPGHYQSGMVGTITVQ